MQTAGIVRQQDNPHGIELGEVELSADLVAFALMACYYSEKGNHSAGPTDWGRELRKGIVCNRTGRRYAVDFQTMSVRDGKVSPHIPGVPGNYVRGLVMTITENWRIEGKPRETQQVWVPLTSLNEVTMVFKGAIL